MTLISLPQACYEMERAIHGDQKIRQGLWGNDHLQSLKVIWLWFTEPVPCRGAPTTDQKGQKKIHVIDRRAEKDI